MLFRFLLTLMMVFSFSQNSFAKSESEIVPCEDQKENTCVARSFEREEFLEWQYYCRKGFEWARDPATNKITCRVMEFKYHWNLFEITPFQCTKENNCSTYDIKAFEKERLDKDKPVRFDTIYVPREICNVGYVKKADGMKISCVESGVKPEANPDEKSSTRPEKNLHELLKPPFTPPFAPPATR